MKLFALLTSFFFALASCQAEEPKNGKFKDDVDPMPEAKTETITLGAGCYWCVEAIFQQLDGVLKTTNGFMGGHIPDPTYEQVSTKTTGHIEVIEVVFDPEKISTIPHHDFLLLPGAAEARRGIKKDRTTSFR